MKSLLKRAAARFAPQTTTAVLSARARAHSHRLVEQWGLAGLNRKLIDALGPDVQAGPFRGMRLSPMTWKEHLGPYLLGTYECELHPWFHWILEQPFTGVVDIGAKFGYYAVGLGRKYPEVRVVAFDTDHWARKATREMAVANGIVGSVDVLGYCTPTRLGSVLTERTLIVSDCEGYERVLFGEGATAGLRSATMIVELHEELSPGVGAAIRASLAKSHFIDETLSVNAAPRSVPTDLDFLTLSEIRQATHEVRPPQTWLLLRPRDV